MYDGSALPINNFDLSVTPSNYSSSRRHRPNNEEKEGMNSAEASDRQTEDLEQPSKVTQPECSQCREKLNAFLG